MIDTVFLELDSILSNDKNVDKETDDVKESPIRIAREEMKECGLIESLSREDVVPSPDNTFLAGGCFASWLQGETPKDLDIFYMKDVKLPENIKDRAISNVEWESDGGKEYTLQLLNAEKLGIFDQDGPYWSFDFRHTQFQISITELLDDALFETWLQCSGMVGPMYSSNALCAIEKRLRLSSRAGVLKKDASKNTKAKLIRRMVKFMKRGYTISENELLRIMCIFGDILPNRVFTEDVGTNADIKTCFKGTRLQGQKDYQTNG